MSLAKKILGNFFYFMTGEVFSKAIGFLAVLYLARTLGADGFGRLGFAEAFLGYFIYLGVAGMDIVAIREISKDKSLVWRYLPTMAALKFAFALAGFAMLTAVAFVFVKQAELRNLVLLYGTVLFSFALSTEWFFQGMEKMKYVSLFRTLRELGYVLLVVLMVGGPDVLFLVPVLRFASMFAAALVLVFIIVRMGYGAGMGIDFKVCKYVTKESMPIIASQMMILLIYNFPMIYMGLKRTTEEVGHYSAVYKVVLFFIGFASIFWYVLFPSLSRLTVESRERLLEFQGKVSRVIVAVAVPIGFIGSVLAPKIMGFLYGDGYEPASDTFRLLIWVGTLVMLNGIYAQGLLSSGGQKGFMKTVAVQTSVSLALNLLLIPSYGAKGAAIAWISAEAVGLFLYKYYYDKVIELSITGFFAKPVIAALVAAFALLATMGVNVLAQIALGIVLYGMTLYAVGGISPGGVRFVKDNLLALRK